MQIYEMVKFFFAIEYHVIHYELVLIVCFNVILW